MAAGSDYDSEVQMFVQRPREIDLAHLRFSADGVPKKTHMKTAMGMIMKRGAVRLIKDLLPLRKVAI